MATNGNGLRGLLAGAVRLVERAQVVAKRPSVRPWLLVGAVVAFLAMAIFSFASLDEEGRSARPLLLLPVVLVGVPATLAFNALEYRAMAKALGYRIRLRSAARVSMAATVANYLPAPGGVAVRAAALKARGSSLGSAVSVNAVAGLLWLGVAAVATGVSLLVGSLEGRGATALLVGAVALLASAVWGSRGGGNWQKTYRELLLVETGVVAVAGVRLWFALTAIGYETSIGAAMAIASSTVVAAAVGIFPAGLGLREAIGGGLAVAVNVPAATAIAALSVDRAVGPVGLAICALFLKGRKGSDDVLTDEAAGEELEAEQARVL